MDSGFSLREPRNDRKSLRHPSLREQSAKQSTLHEAGYGLLRFARNDEVERGCDKSTRRANQQKSVQPFAQKYSAHAVGQISDLTPRVSPNEGRLAIVTNARWDAVDAKCAKDERA